MSQPCEYKACGACGEHLECHELAHAILCAAVLFGKPLFHEPCTCQGDQK